MVFTWLSVSGYPPVYFDTTPSVMGPFTSRGFFLQPHSGRASQDCVCSSRSSFRTGSLFGSWKAVPRPVAWDLDPGVRGRGQGTEMLAELGGLAAVAQLVFRSALAPEHAEGRWTARRAFLQTAPAVGIRSLRHLRQRITSQGSGFCTWST